MNRAAKLYARALPVKCPYCGAMPGFRCTILDPVSTVGPATNSRPHQARLDEAGKKDGAE